ncbi:type VI secretion system baseplate subunit TssE [Burkholderia multivorans]|jgi:type VI secretion system protein ImpF|uniref:type VI secretion system baseplate subunit TssE n=1 Tax=Burkholderia multivorans TaxID=87883 RepID=UPI00057E3B16|nr:type VI secretion system baseplate subunit TssE [Burkholderia multivorans]KHS16373.1 cytoplasmic protein [Burkholderia multivorans]KHS20472.1 cytoplasmic protein [Burkholderia multivorans]MBR7921755.1 type VI secretion system baseplate subunit TssE [Burkholderia multivorans]MBR8102523.1 type VI secretion system baseplate subunit TssE [Burkholderia multivorans]MBR8338806.1 type VI secretion system baseplate subunit TssE [Burkholderia multivorans]
MTERRKRQPGTDSPTARTPRRASSHLMPTLLDRLRDDAPHRQTEAPEAYTATRKQMRDIVQRDLAYLLNTTSIEDRIDRARYPQAAASTVNFGVPPLAGTFIASRRWSDVETMIRRAIGDFEPRLIPESLVVSPRTDVDSAGEHRNVLAFEVRGLIHMDPYPLEFMVQSSLDLETSEIRITGMRAG